MRYFYFILSLMFLASCEELTDVKEIDGPCTIELVDGGTITTEGNIEILKETGSITYRDEDGKLWSLLATEYSSYSCGN
jgi:hypothetical protein